MIWHVVMCRAGERSHALVHDFLDGHRAGRHGPVCYVRTLRPDEPAQLRLIVAEFELGMAYGVYPPNNEIRGFKWTVPIQRTFPSGFHEELARASLPWPGALGR